MVSVPNIAAINQLIEQFESLQKRHQGGEVWSGRELMVLFGYTSWKKFRSAILRAGDHIKVSGADPNEHLLREFDESVKDGRTKGEEENYYMTRHGAKMLMQELQVKDSDLAAFAKTYFAGQTRVAEIIQKGMADLGDRLKARSELKHSEKDLGATLWDRGVKTGVGIATIRSEGDKALFGIQHG
jgi:DNA-damage-inducible protein D